MGEVVNLRRARKARTRTLKDATAAANRAAFGRTKAEKNAAKTAADRAARNLDGAKLDQ